MNHCRKMLMLMLAGLVWLAAGAAPSLAQTCQYGFKSMPFGTLKLADARRTDGVTSLTVTCTGEPNQVVRLCPTITSTDMMRTGGEGYAAKLTLFTDPSHASVWSVGSGGIDVALDTNGAGETKQNFYGMISFGGAGKAGTYTGMLDPVFLADYSTIAPCSSAAAAKPANMIRAKAAPTTRTSSR